MEAIEWPNQSERRARRTIGWLLRLAVAVHCVAVAWHWMGLDAGSPIAAYLRTQPWGQPWAATVDTVACWTFVFLGGMILARPVWPACLAVGLWMAAIAAATVMTADNWFAYLAPASKAARYLGPIALALLWGAMTLPRPLPPWRREAALWLLRIAAAATFIGHGIEALAHHPNFIALIVDSGRNVLAMDVPPAYAEAALYAIGIVDLAVAVALLTRRWRIIALWAAIWATLAAASRMTAMGPEAWDETGRRLLNGFVPLSVLAWWTLYRPGEQPLTGPLSEPARPQEQPAVSVPAPPLVEQVAAPPQQSDDPAPEPPPQRKPGEAEPEPQQEQEQEQVVTLADDRWHQRPADQRSSPS